MPESIYYALCLVVSLVCLGILDLRFKLAFFYDRKRTIRTLAGAFAIFVVWDILGISLGIFFTGPSPYLTGLRLGPEFPVEEVLFLLLLTYNALLLWRGYQKIWPRT